MRDVKCFRGNFVGSREVHLPAGTSRKTSETQGTMDNCVPCHHVSCPQNTKRDIFKKFIVSLR